MRIRRFARWYRRVEYAAFGRALERRRFAFLGHLAGARRVLIPGEGDGRALAQLLKLAPNARFDVIERSAEMIRLARARTGDSTRVQFICRDVGDVQWKAGSYDAIVTLFFLDCFTEQEARILIARLVQSLTPQGRWLVSDFAIPGSGWKRWHARLWVWAMYRFFRMVSGLSTRSLPPIADLLQEAGMQRTAYETERAGMMTSEVWVRSRLS